MFMEDVKEELVEDGLFSEWVVFSDPVGVDADGKAGELPGGCIGWREVKSECSEG